MDYYLFDFPNPNSSAQPEPLELRKSQSPSIHLPKTPYMCVSSVGAMKQIRQHTLIMDGRVNRKNQGSRIKKRGSRLAL